MAGERWTAGAVAAPPGSGAVPVMPARGPGAAPPDRSARGADRPPPEPPPPGDSLAGAARRRGTAAVVRRWTAVAGGAAGRADVNARAGASARTGGRGGTAGADGCSEPFRTAGRCRSPPAPGVPDEAGSGAAEETARCTGRPAPGGPDRAPAPADGVPEEVLPPGAADRTAGVPVARTGAGCPCSGPATGGSRRTAGAASDGGEDRGAPRAERRRGVPAVGTSAGGFGGADTGAGSPAAGVPGTVRPVPPDVRRWTGRPGPVVAPPCEDRGTETEGTPGRMSVEDPPGAASAGPGPAGVTGGSESGGADVMVGTEGPVVARRGRDGVTTGSARRCTAGPAGALVSPVGAGSRPAADGTAVTLGPADPVAATGRLVCRRDDPPTWSDGSSGAATGRASEGSSRPEAGSAGVASTPRTRPPGAPSSTACESVPVNDGFCQVVSRPPNAESATEPRPAVARWMGGSEGQAAARTGRFPSPPPTAPAGLVPAPGATRSPGTAAGPAADTTLVPRSRPPPRSRSKTPTPRHLSPAPRWTSAAICSV